MQFELKGYLISVKLSDNEAVLFRIGKMPKMIRNVPFWPRNQFSLNMNSPVPTHAAAASSPKSTPGARTEMGMIPVPC